jgi:hypothetical protein
MPPVAFLPRDGAERRNRVQITLNFRSRDSSIASKHRDASFPSWWTRTSLVSASALDRDELDEERLSVRAVVNEV